jgi:glycosyltransferase involved in cell wall biosynthesis
MQILQIRMRDFGNTMKNALLPSNVAVLIPAYDEARTIGEVVREAKKVAKTVLVVDDGSTDGSALLAEAAGAQVLRRARNEGQGKALADGILVLHDLGLTQVITLDGDAAHAPLSAIMLWEAHIKSVQI